MSADTIIRMTSCLAVVISVFSVVFLWQVMNWYARFAEDEIAIKRFIGIGEQVYPYNSVQQIVLTSHYKQDNEHLAVRRQDVHIRFNDGRTWETDGTFPMPDGAERDRFLDFLHRQTGKPITRARLITDVPGW
jgi:hypothetical protein